MISPFRSVSRRFAVASVVLLLAVASGDAEPQTSPDPPTDPAIADALKKFPVTRDKPCSVLFPVEVGKVLGVSISMREIVDEVTCHYVFDKPAEGAPAGKEQFLEIKVHWGGGQTTVQAARGASALLGSEMKAFEKLPGIGDEAYLGPLASLLVFRKGDIGVEIDLRMIPNGREAGIKLAKLIASRI